MAFQVRVNGQAIGLVERADIERRAVVWKKAGASVDVGDAAGTRFETLDAFLAHPPRGASPQPIVPPPAASATATAFAVRVDGQSLGILARADIDRRAATWKKANARIEVGDAAGVRFEPLDAFLGAAHPAGAAPSSGPFDVRINGQALGVLSRADVERRSVMWQRTNARVDVAAAGTQAFAPLAQFLRASPPAVVAPARPGPARAASPQTQPAGPALGAGTCRYCDVRPAEWSGDAAFLVPRCSRCRAIHRVNDGITLLFKGLFLAVMLVAAAFERRFIVGILIGLGILFLSRVKFYGAVIPLHGWVNGVDWFRRRWFKQPSEYYARVWKGVPMTMSNVVDFAAAAMIVFAVVEVRSAWAALFPVAWSMPGPIVQAGQINELALFDFMARVDGATYWIAPTARGYAAGFCALLGAIWLCEKAIALALPRICGSRPCGWPRLG